MRRVVNRSSMRKTRLASEVDDGNNNNMSSVCWLDYRNPPITVLSPTVAEPFVDTLSIDSNNNTALIHSPHAQAVLIDNSLTPSNFGLVDSYLPEDPSSSSMVLDTSQSIIVDHRTQPNLPISRRKRFAYALIIAIIIPITVIIYRILHRSLVYR